MQFETMIDQIADRAASRILQHAAKPTYMGAKEMAFELGICVRTLDRLRSEMRYGFHYTEYKDVRGYRYHYQRTIDFLTNSGHIEKMA